MDTILHQLAWSYLVLYQPEQDFVKQQHLEPSVHLHRFQVTTQNYRIMFDASILQIAWLIVQVTIVYSDV